MVVEAIQWTGDNEAELIEFTGREFYALPPEDRSDDPEQTATVLDDEHHAWVAVYTEDWITKSILGDIRLLRRDDFDAMYDLVDSDG
jgi:hypothetical protein